MSNLHLQVSADPAPKPESAPEPEAASTPNFVDAVHKVQQAGKHWMKKLGRSHKDHAEFAAQVYAFAEAHQDAGQLVGALKALGIKVPKATQDKHLLLATKLAVPKADTKAQSSLSRALGYIQINRKAGQSVVDFISESGGVDACARAYTKAMRAVGCGAEPTSEAGIDRLRALVAPTEVVGEDIMPDGAGVYLLVVERQPDGAAMSYGFVANDKLIDRACRMVGSANLKE